MRWLLVSILLTCLTALSGLVRADLPKPFRFDRGKDGKWWLVRPDGSRWWSLAACCTGPGTPWESYDPKNRSYAAHRLYVNGAGWVRHVQDELRGLGYNSLGGWSEVDLFRKHGGNARLPYFVVLHLGSYVKAPWNDLFDKQAERGIELAAREQIPKLRDDPFLVGYFSDNELGWWDDSLFLAYLGLPAGAPGRERLMDLVEETYQKDIAKLRADWTTKAKSFSELRKAPDLRLRAGGRGMRVVNDWTEKTAQRYYSLVKRAIRRHDPVRPILGDRYIQYYPPAVAKASAKYVDALSTNMGADWNDGSYARFMFEGLYRATKKPLLITEFYMAARENRSGNPNTGDAFPKVETQGERATAYKRCLEHLASLPFVVGAHWFQYFDEPEHGRADGEDFNMGLVDIEGRPYEEMAAASRSFDPMAIHANAKPLPVCDVIPGSPANPMNGLKAWNRTHGFVPWEDGIPFGDLYLSQDEAHLYLGLYLADFIDEKLYASGRMPESERPSFRVRFDNGYSVSVRFGGKNRAAAVDRPEVAVTEKAGLRPTLILKLQRSRLPAGSRLRFEARATTHSAGETMDWKANVKWE
ncbi:MAG: hypothetical protein KIS66_07050 [Fimbriimonadaceae bacterium]|nr:hypothetical protein [Fimbriimonadaceae bacterium]